MFWGSITALLTPFEDDGRLDEAAFQKFVEWQVEQGTHGLVPCGTTGESPTLSHKEHHRVVDLCLEATAGRVPVIAGAGSNSTEEAISLSRHAEKSGANAILSVVPYYNKPTQEGMYQHFKAIHDSVDLPVIVYNIPGRSVVNMDVKTLARLAKLPNIVGVKDATCDLTRPVLERLEIGPEFCLLSGEDGTIGAYLGQGGDGCISVTSNVAPKQCSDLHISWKNNDIDTFSALRNALMPLHEALFCETSPAPVKYAASRLGFCANMLRLPLVVASDAAQIQVDRALEGLGLLNDTVISYGSS